VTRFSVVIPTYQREPLIGRAIESALAQTHPPDEIIVVDDGSTDETEAVVNTFGRLVHYVRQPNSGVSVARNRGAQMARSPWVAFLDSDDRWRPNHLGSLNTTIRETNSEASLYFADCVRLGDHGHSRRQFDMAGLELDGDHLLTDAMTFAMLRVQPMMIQASAVQREAFLRHGGMDHRLRHREDTHFFHSFGLSGSFCAVANVGTEIYDDASPAARLTAAHPTGSAVYIEATVLLYTDLLERSKHVELSHRKEIKRRLADGLAARAKQNVGNSRGLAVSDAAKAFLLAPWAGVGRASRLLRR
jgi:glycosyltransferase involved in cell wall biosynthesis